MSKRVKITKVKSTIDHTKRQKATLEALGLRKLSQSREFDWSPALEGMVRTVEHLVTVENL